MKRVKSQLKIVRCPGCKGKRWENPKAPKGKRIVCRACDGHGMTVRDLASTSNTDDQI